jgi:5-methylcytosine-specific restriction protein A
VYLFHSSLPIVHLSLNQGTTEAEKEFGSEALRVLRERAALMRSRLPDFAGSLGVTEIDLGSTADLPAGYVAGHALGYTYQTDELPSERELRSDLHTIVRAYRALTFRGGREDTLEEGAEDEDVIPSASLTERRRYRFHRRIERNPKASKEAKKFHGTRCQACRLDFSERYGSIGQGFIEAHHLRPISSLEEGSVVTYNAASDFAVLCSNCHRMIHRSKDPADVGALRALIAESDSRTR